MRIFKWDSKFSPSKESPIAPVWIRIEGLPLYLFEDNSLCSISNAIGNPLRIDPRNIDRAILSSARICVELDVSKPCIDSIWISIIDEVIKESIDGFWVKVLYDIVPLYCTACSHIGHGRDYCKLSAADQVFDNLPQTDTFVESAPDGNATAQRIVKSSCDAQNSIPDVPSSSYTAPFCQQQDMTSKHTKYWIERKGTRSLKSQLQNTRYKDKALSIENSFSVLDVEQKEGITKEIHSNFQKVLQVERVELAEADLEKKVQPNQARQEVEGSILLVAPDVGSSGDYIEVVPAAVSSREQIVEGSTLLVAPVVCSSGDKNEMALAAFSSSEQIGEILTHHNLSTNLKTADAADCSFVDQRDRGVAILGRSHQAVVAECDSGLVEVLPAPVTPSTPHSVLTSATPSKSWENMVEEEEQEDKKFAQLKAITVGHHSSNLVKISGPETIQDLITAPVKTNFNERVAQKDHNEGLALKNKTKTAKRVDTKRHISQDDSLVDEVKFTQDNPRTDLPPEESKYFINPEGTMIGLNEYKEAGFRLIARRSLSPTGRSSPKLISLRQKVANILVGEERTTLKDLKEYAEEFQADVERACRSKNSSTGEKLPTPSGPGQSRQRRNRGRNRSFYGTPDKPQRYQGQGSH
ncbi:hypothetical protein LIER_34242 [Lithospermum erythrorhizon]|uniref:DUF4283 domain-containing protein n=1 Tax=Lithospermum erythrorhizon TaxID=34254 RepID=A0AAV3RZS5_LITER